MSCLRECCEKTEDMTRCVEKMVDTLPLDQKTHQSIDQILHAVQDAIPDKEKKE